MSIKELENLIKREFDPLKLINSYRKEFEEKYGEIGVKEMIDDLLDNINEFREELNKNRNLK